MKPWLVLGIAILGGAAATVLAFLLFGYEYGFQPSVADMEIAAGLGGALAGMLTLVHAS